MNYTAMTADEEARIVDSIAKIRKESVTLTTTLNELEGFLRGIYETERPEIKPDPNSVYILKEMREILDNVVNVSIINDRTKQNSNYMKFIAHHINCDLEEMAANRLKELRLTEENDDIDEYI